MRLQILVCLFLSLFITGCWDASKSPLVKNLSGQEITLLVIYEDHEEAFIIRNNEVLLFRNLTGEKTMRSMKVVDKHEESRTFTKQEIIDSLAKKHNAFVVNKELRIHTENSY